MPTGLFPSILRRMRRAVLFCLVASLTVACAAKRTLAGDASVSLPCEIARNLCYLESRLNGHAVCLALDTGSSWTVLEVEKSRKFGFRASGSGNAEGGGTGASNAFAIVRGITIQTGPVSLVDQTILAMPFQYVAERVGHPTDGTLGSNLYLDHVVEIDYSRKRVTLTTPSAWRPAEGMEPLPLVLEGNLPFILATVKLPSGAEVQGKFLVDTGQILSGLLLTEAFQKAHSEILPSKRLYPPKVSAVGGDFEYSVGRIPRIRLGHIEINKPITAFPKRAAGIYARPDLAGVIGADLLSRFDFAFDYGGKKMYLRPNCAFSAAAEFDRSGLQLGIRPPRYTEFLVTGVTRGTPAHHAGIRKGDIVEALNGREARELSLTEVLEKLRRPGPCRLLIRRGNRKFAVSLVLRRLL